LLKRDQLIGANFSFQHFPIELTVQSLRKMGFERLELWGIAPHLDLFHNQNQRLDGLRTLLCDCGMTVHCFTPEQVFYPVNIASGDPSYRQASVRRFLKAADIAAELGASYLFLTPGRGFETETSEHALANSLQSLSQIAAHAQSLGIRCLLEPLQRAESNIVNNLAGLTQLWRDLNADNVDIVLDLVAMATAGDRVADYIDSFGTRLAHVHVADGTPAGHLVWGDGQLPLGQYLDELSRAQFKGTLTFEPFGNGSYALDPVATWRRSLSAVSPYVDGVELS